MNDSPLLNVFDRSGVESRAFVFPKEYYLEHRTFKERNDAYISQGAELGVKALEETGIDPREIDALIFVTTTGLATPSLDSIIAQKLGMREDVIRMPFFGIGCAGGAFGIARGADYLHAHPDATVAVLSVEICSLSFRVFDLSPSQIVGASIFADGAGAIIMRCTGNSPHVVQSRSRLFPDSAHVMGWDFDGEGMRLILSREVIPFLKSNVSMSQADHYILHPGGRGVLDAYNLPEEKLRWSRASLRSNGNLSSASILFVLDDFLKTGIARAGDRALLLAVGPGFAMESSLLEW